jgi:hypothetical protein
MHSAVSRRQGSMAQILEQRVAAMRQSEFDLINAGLDRAEFAIEELRKKAVELRRKRDLAKAPEEIAALNLDAAELKRQLRKISDAVHTGNPAPHLRLVSGAE